MKLSSYGLKRWSRQHIFTALHAPSLKSISGVYLTSTCVLKHAYVDNWSESTEVSEFKKSAITQGPQGLVMHVSRPFDAQMSLPAHRPYFD